MKLANKLRLTQPDLKVLYTRDLEAETKGRTPTLPEAKEIICKPYTPEGLLESIQAHLEAGAPDSDRAR